MRLPLRLFFLSALGPSYHVLCIHNDVAQSWHQDWHQGRPQACGESKVVVLMTSIKHRNNTSHEVEEARDSCLFTRRKLHASACFNYKQENWRGIFIYHLMPM